MRVSALENHSVMEVAVNFEGFVCSEDLATFGLSKLRLSRNLLWVAQGDEQGWVCM